MREKRGAHLVGRKRPWDNYIETSKHLLPSGIKLARRNSTGNCETGKVPCAPMRSLSVTLPAVSNDFNRSSGIHSSDLLTTVESRNNVNALKERESELKSLQREPVITYPKYIPSYAVEVEKSGVKELPQTNSRKLFVFFAKIGTRFVCDPADIVGRITLARRGLVK